VLSRGHIGSSGLLLNNAWAVTQSVAIESSGGVVLVYGLQSIREKDKVKAWLYLILSMTLALAGGIMLFMQLAGWEAQGDSPFMLTLFALRCIVSIGYIYLCWTKNFRFTSGHFESVQAFLADAPNATVRDVASALEISLTTANKWMHRVREKS
jgi:uncharacterized membrane protein